jgi:hypothetical protein
LVFSQIVWFTKFLNFGEFGKPNNINLKIDNMKNLTFFALILLVAILTQSCASSRKLTANLVPVTDHLLKDLPREEVQYYSGPDSVIFRRIQKGNTEVKDGIIFENNALLNKLVIPPCTKGKLVSSEEDTVVMIISFDENNDTLVYTFRPDKNNSGQYTLCTNKAGSVVFNEKIFKLMTSGTLLYADKRHLPTKKVVHISKGNSVSGNGKKSKTKNKENYDDF